MNKKQRRKFFSISSIIFAVIFVFLVIIRVYYTFNPPVPRQPAISYKITPSVSSLKVGDKTYIPVYLSGFGVSKVRAFDIKFYYDQSKFKLTNAMPGDFFANYLTVKWDKKDGWFALASSPSTAKTPVELNSPIITIELTAIAKSESTPVSTGTSTVYLTKIGGYHPPTTTTYLNIK